MRYILIKNIRAYGLYLRSWEYEVALISSDIFCLLRVFMTFHIYPKPALGVRQDRSGRAENPVPTGIRSRTVQPVVSRYTD
jgi:hypothetical protein